MGINGLFQCRFDIGVKRHAFIHRIDDKPLMKRRFYTDVESSLERLFRFDAFLSAHIKVIVNASLEILHQFIDGLSLIGDNRFFQAKDTAIKKHLIGVKLHVTRKPLILHRVFHGLTPVIVKKSLMLSTVLLEATFPGCGA